METKKKPNIIKLSDGREYDVDVLSELTKDNEEEKFKENLLWKHIDKQPGGRERFLKRTQERNQKSS